MEEEASGVVESALGEEAPREIMSEEEASAEVALEEVT